MSNRLNAAKYLVALLVTLSLVFGAFTVSVFAQNQATVTVDNVAGLVDDIVDVEIVLSDFDNLGVGGISGGQFQLSYDSELVEVEDMIPGDFINWRWSVQFNPDIGNGLAYTWGSGEVTHQNARIVTFRFRLLQAGTVTLEMSELYLTDDSVPSQDVPGELIKVVNGQIMIDTDLGWD